MTLLFSILSIVLSIGVFVVGVVAASSVSTSVRGTFSFEVSTSDFFVEIVGTVTGQEKPEDVTNYYANSFQNPTGEFSPWQLPELSFKSVGDGVEEIVFSFNVINYNESAIRVAIDNIQQDSQRVLNTPSQPITILGATFDESNHPVYSSGIVSVSLSVVDMISSFSVLNSFTVSLSFVQ